jgi:ABC-type antimicrobial peptide transport system permease subunit
MLLLASMLGAIGFVALGLAAAGVYGVTSYAVSQRTREIGLRIALGARRRDVLSMIVRQGAAPVVLGLGLGAMTASVLAYWTSVALQDFGLRDPSAFVAVFAVLLIVGVLACYLPARRAARVDPMVPLRVG